MSMDDGTHMNDALSDNDIAMATLSDREVQVSGNDNITKSKLNADSMLTTEPSHTDTVSDFTETSQFEESDTLLEMNNSLGISSGIALINPVAPVVVNPRVSQAPSSLENVRVPSTAASPTQDPSPTLLTSTILQPGLLGANPASTNTHLPLISSPSPFIDSGGGSTVVNPSAPGAPLLGMTCSSVPPMAYIGASSSLLTQDQQKLSNNLQNLMFLQDVNTKSFGTAVGTPVVVLVNNPEKGTVEANMLYQHPVSAEVLLIPSNADSIQPLLSMTQVPRDKIPNESAEGAPSQTEDNGDKNEAIAEKVYCCDCGKSFTSDWRLKYHQAIHSGVKSLECNIDGCGRKFSWPAHLHYHHLTHTGDRNYKCDYAGCEKTFYTAQRLNVHKRTHTGEKPYVCVEDKCNKRFTTAGNLKNHMRIHTGEKPYQCTEENCNRKFAEYSSLRKHKLVHSGEKPFKCKICGKTFSQSGSCKVHMARHQASKRPSSTVEKNSENSGTRTNVVLKVENQLAVLEQGDEEEILHYRDFQGSEAVVFSQGVSEHVVTVTTQQPEMGSDNLGLVSGLLGAEEVLSSSGEIHSEPLETSSEAGVLVLSHPHDMVSMTTNYHQGHQASREEIVYTGDLLSSDLDHEEIASNISQHELSGTISRQGLSEQSTMTHTSSTEKEVDIDPMMESDDENDMVEAK